MWDNRQLHDKKRALHDIFSFPLRFCNTITMDEKDKGDFPVDQKKHTDYLSPPTGQAVSRFDHCPCFSARRSLLATEPICWFCRFAKFDLFSDKLPETGICRHPAAQTAIKMETHKPTGNPKEKR